MPSCRVKFMAGALLLCLLAGCQSAPDPQARLARWHNNQGVVHMDQHNYSRGRDEFARAIALDPEDADGHANLGIAYYSLGKYDSALVALQTALRHDANHLHARYTLGLIFLAQGKDYDQALEAFEAVRRADDDDPLVHYYLGRAREKLGQGEAAVEEFRRAIRLDPHNVSAYYALAQLLRQLNRQEEFQQVLATFNQLQQAGHEGVSSSYQGQGKYAEAAADEGGADPGRDDAQVELEFAQAGPPPADFPEEASAVTALDYDRDGDLDLLVSGDRLEFYRNDGGNFAPARELAASGSFQDAVFADLDNDLDDDLLLCGAQILLLRREDEGAWAAPVGIAGPCRQAVLADADHDGDLDLLALAAGGNRLLGNDGSGKFTDLTASAGLGASAAGRQAVFSDFDNDRDLDFLILGQGSAQLFTNNRDGTFADIGDAVGLATLDAVDVWAEDFDQDNSMDVCALGADGRLTLHLNQRGRQFKSQPLPPVEGQARGLRSADLDNDGDMDLLVFGTAGVQAMVQRGGQFQRAGQALGAAVRQALADDFDGDGDADVWADGQVWRNQTRGGNWIAVALQGLNSNRNGIGAKVEVRTAHRHQKRELRGGSRDARTLCFGLAGADSVEFVRLLWPGGVRQTELATGAGQRLALTELNRKGTSCPILYVWDGGEFRFVTDILGGAIIGYLLAPGQYYAPDTDEYVRLGRLEPTDGRYVVQIANQLEEIIYLDAVHLLAVDHPEEVEIFPNERLLSGPPYPEFRLYPVTRLQPPRAASDHRGLDVLAQLREIDDEWYEGFDRTPIHGYAQEYSLTLDLGDLSQNAHPVLLGYGWVDYAHSSSNWAAAQQGLSLYPPELEVPGPDGEWVVAEADMGCPAGLPKHMLLDLKGLLPVGEHRVRITTNTPVYWDQFLVGEATGAPHQVARLLPSHGDLHWRGYPAHTAIKGTFAFRYHYDQAQDEADWGTHEGAFTRLGEVTELLGAADDRYVIMFHGDEVTAQFDEAALPPPAPGQRRTFLLWADGFGKDMDFHSAHSLTVDPLPFHGMSSYPYPASESYPLDEARLRYLLEYNTRQVRGYYD